MYFSKCSGVKFENFEENFEEILKKIFFRGKFEVFFSKIFFEENFADLVVIFKNF